MKQLLLLSALFAILATSTVYAQEDSSEGAPIAKPRKEREPIGDRIVIGGNFNLRFGNYTNINLSPIVGYRVTEDLVLGAGPSYIYTSINYGNVKYRYSVYGGRLYGRQKVIDNFYAQAEYEVLNVQNYTDQTNPDARKWIQAPLVGVSYVQPIGNRSAFIISVLYNLNYQQYLTPYANPIIRVGFNL